MSLPCQRSLPKTRTTHCACPGLHFLADHRVCMQGMFVTGATFRPDGMNFAPNAEDVIEVLNKGVLDQALAMAQVCQPLDREVY